MASLKCNNCGYGIHYHDEPDGTEHFAISFSTWEWYLLEGKSIIRSFLDGPQDYLTIWRCKECGCLHTFPAHSVMVKRAYAPCEYDPAAEIINGIKYRIFDDYLFDAVTEDNITAKDFDSSNKHGACYYAMIGDNYIYLYDDAKFQRVTKCFQAIITDNSDSLTG